MARGLTAVRPVVLVVGLVAAAALGWLPHAAAHAGGYANPVLRELVAGPSDYEAQLQGESYTVPPASGCDPDANGHHQAPVADATYGAGAAAELPWGSLYPVSSPCALEYDVVSHATYDPAFVRVAFRWSMGASGQVRLAIDGVAAGTAAYNAPNGASSLSPMVTLPVANPTPLAPGRHHIVLTWTGNGNVDGSLLVDCIGFAHGQPWWMNTTRDCDPLPMLTLNHGDFGCASTGIPSYVAFVTGEPHSDLTSFDWDYGPSWPHTYADHSDTTGLPDGNYTVTLTVTDIAGHVLTASGALTKGTCAPCTGCSTTQPSTPTNEPPTLDAIPRIAVEAGQSVRFTLHARDLEGDPVTLSAAQIPRGATFDASTQVFHWTTRAADEGETCGLRFVATEYLLLQGDAYVGLTRADVDSLPPDQQGTVIPQGAVAQACVLVFVRAHDGDHDGVQDVADDCPGVADRAQADQDGDGVGDACDPTPCTPDTAEGAAPTGNGACPRPSPTPAASRRPAAVAASATAPSQCVECPESFAPPTAPPVSHPARVPPKLAPVHASPALSAASPGLGLAAAAAWRRLRATR